VSPESTDGQPLIGGRYALGELLGRGGMAEVRKGTDTRLGRTVAVKRLRTDLASDNTFQARFRREAQSAASLNHPAIVAVYDTGEVPAGDGSGVSQPYIVMEYVAGRTLRDILREGRKILPERALEISSGVLSALDYSHRAGIIHRDIKPGNVMLTPSGDVKVMDFGIARAMSDASSTKTQTAAVVGTAQYLSPEQARGEAVDSRSDVYSAGCLLYELLTGRPPFIGDSPVAVAYQHVREQAAPPSDHDTDLPPEIDAIVMKSLAKRVEDRYQSAAAMRGDIERYLAGHTVHVTPPPPLVEPPTTVTTPTPVVAPVPPPVQEPVEDERGTRPGLLVFLALLLVIVLGLAAYLLPKMFASPTDQVQVPRLAGMTENQARKALADAGFEVGKVDHAYNTKVAANRVIDQTPDADAFADKSTPVSFTLSLGAHPTKVPNIVGQTRANAEQQLQDAHLNGVFKHVDSDQPKGTVVSTDPQVGQQVARDSDVTVNLSRGPKQVPDVVGMTQDDAVKLLKARGFDPQISDDNSSTEAKGTVTGQTPPADTPLQQGSPVYLTVSTYEPSSAPTTTPPTTEPTSPPTSLPTSPVTPS
jgi:serine/threonine-protein kinase